MITSCVRAISQRGIADQLPAAAILIQDERNVMKPLNECRTLLDLVSNLPTRPILGDPGCALSDLDEYMQRTTEGDHDPECGCTICKYENGFSRHK